MTETPDEIAAGLTKAQRTTVLSGREPDGRGKWPRIAVNHWKDSVCSSLE